VYHAVKEENGYALADPENDVLKIAVVNRYADTAPAIAFIKNTGIRNGAFASSVAHDSHNIICAGTSDAFMAKAVNLIIRSRGGLSVVNEETEYVIPLPVAGLMTDRDAAFAAKGYQAAHDLVKKMGSNLRAPFMSLSFMALLVIPALKLSDKGLFDGNSFRLIPLFGD
jgi:adenine deaminase